MMKLDQALELARRFHHGATDKAGRPYISHVQRVVDTVADSDHKLTAALHDLLEDTPLTSTDLLAAGCPPRVIAAVEALTRRPGEEYEVPPASGE
jgi:(p)ppGpp synthase/HD superfamily hydrolase